MKFAVPTVDGKLCMHFGHCQKFAIIDVNNANEILSEEYIDPPAHEPGVLPGWISGLGVNCVIVGGMGQRAQQLFMAKNVKVVTGAMDEDPKEIVKHFLNDSLQTGPNACDH